MPAPALPEDPIDQLLASVLDLPEPQWSATIDALCSAHPEHAAGLRRRFRALQRFGLAPSPPVPRPGGVLGPFELERVLGAGAMGVVYRARDRRTGVECAVKVLRPEFAASPAATQRLRREGEALRRLEHRHLCRMHEIGEVDGVVYLAMELLSGETLAARLERARRGEGSALSWPEAVALLAKIARGLAVAHDVGVVHRDVKPGNILVRHGGEPVLFDFGLASLLEGDALTRTGIALGTPAYMPPEQVRGARDVNVRADVWALGAVLFECLALRPPFVAAQREEAFWRILHGEPDDLLRVAPRTPRGLRHVVERCLEKVASRRYADAGELADDLDRVRAGHRPNASAPAPWRRLGRTLRRHPRAASAMLGTAIALTAGAYVVESERRAARVADTALASAAEELAHGDPVIAALLAREAFADAPGPATRSRLLATLAQLHQADEVRTHGDTAFAQPSPDGRTLLCAVVAATDETRPAVALAGTWPRVLQRAGYSVAWSSDGARFAVGRGGVPPLLYASDSGAPTEAQPQEGNMRGPRIFQFRPNLAFGLDGALYWGDDSGSVHRQGANGDEARVEAHTAPVIALFATARGVLSVGEDGSVVASAPDGSDVRRVHLAPRACEVARLSGDGAWLVLGLRGGPVQRIRVDGEPPQVKTWPDARARSCLAVDHDGGRILAGRLDHQTLELWEPDGASPARVVHYDDTVAVAAAFAPPSARDVAFAAAFAGNHITVFDEHARPTHVLRGHRRMARHVAFAVNGVELLSAGTDQTVRRWRLDVPGFPVIRVGRGAVWTACWLPDGQHVALLAAPDRLQVWTTKGTLVGEAILASRGGGAMRLAVVRDGEDVVLTACGELLPAQRFAWRPESPGEFRPLPMPADTLALGLHVSTAATWMATNARALIEVRADGSIGREARLPLQPLAVVSDGRTVFVADRTQLIAVEPGESAPRELPLPSPALSLAILDANHIVVGHLDGCVRVLRKDGHVEATWSLHGSGVDAVAVSPDGERIATGGGDGRARVLTRRGEALLDLPHRGSVRTVAFAPDGETLLTAGSNRAARVWPVTDAALRDLAARLPFRNATEAELARLGR
jgi:WD40 repeat protein